MTEITLQAYKEEINQLIEETRFLEALAHIRYILETYPRWIDAYYLLGKAMLEAELPKLAMDMFRRVLSADPEHLTARIGLGIAHEQLDNLNAAIWNLERAFELDPSDESLSEELRSLYGRRDGQMPDHIALTRAGLARLYMRGGLTWRAVEELRDLLKEMPDRADLQLALAEAYWRDGQIVQASEMCQQILTYLPYSLKANLLLGTLWLNSGQTEGQRYLDQAQEIDPLNLFAQQLFGNDTPLPVKEVTMERLMYTPGEIAVDQKTKWFQQLEAASISVGISEAPPEMSESDMRLVDITADLESQIEIPDWLSEMGALSTEEEEEEEELPDWLSSIEEEAEQTEEATPATEETTPGWLRDLQARDQDQPPAEESPDWLQELQPAGATSEEEVPDWLQQLQPTEEAPAEAAPVAEAEEEVPDWLQDLQPTEEAPEETTEEAGFFGWHSFDGQTVEVTPQEQPPIITQVPPEPEVEETPEGVLSGDDALAWLESLAAGKEEELRAKAKAESEARVAEILGRKPKPPAAPEPEVTPEPEVEETPEGILSGDNALAWLESLAEGKEEELRAKAEAESEARVAEILGRKPKPPAAPEPEVPPEPEVEETPESEEFFGWHSFDGTPVQMSGEPELPEETTEAEVVEETVEAEPELTLEAEETFFGWHSFDRAVVQMKGEANLPAAEARQPKPPQPPESPTPEEEVKPLEEAARVTKSAPPAAKAEPRPDETAQPKPPQAKKKPRSVPAKPTPRRARAKAKPSASKKPARKPAPSAPKGSGDVDELRAYLKRKRSDHATRLTLARLLWESGETKEALTHYGKLIRAGKKMKEVMADLQKYVAATPNDPVLLRTLGDAYMKDGLLDKALEIYNQAMDLL